MYLSTNSQELKSTLQHNIILDYSETIEEYALLKYNQEKEYKQFKIEIDQKIKDIKQILSENFVSPRRIMDSIRLSKLNCNFSTEKIFEIICASIEQPSALAAYKEVKDVIIKCIQEIINYKDQLKQFKNKQKEKLKNLIQEISGLTPMYLIKGAYNSLKNSLKFFEVECRSDIKIYNGNDAVSYRKSLTYLFTKVFEKIISTKSQDKKDNQNNQNNKNIVTNSINSIVQIKKEIKKNTYLDDVYNNYIPPHLNLEVFGFNK